MAGNLTLNEELAKIDYDITRYKVEINRLQLRQIDIQSIPHRHLSKKDKKELNDELNQIQEQIGVLKGLIQDLEEYKYKSVEAQQKKEEEDLLRIPSYKDFKYNGQGKMKYCKCKNCKR